MSVTLWLTVRQVRQALRGGQPDTARRLLDPFIQDGYRKAIALLPEVARGYRLRAEQALRRDDADAAWKDLLAAEGLNAADPELAAVRGTLTKLGLAECRAALLAGNPAHVFTALARLKQRTAFHPDFEWHEAAAREWVLAAEMADRGDFSAALATLDRGRAKVPPDLHFGFDECRRDLARRHDEYAAAAAMLHDAAAAQRWADVLRAADRVTAVAPDHRDARSLKTRAWKVLQPGDEADVHPEPRSAPSREVVELAWAANHGGSAFAPTKTYPLAADPTSVSPGSSPAAAKRFVLWVDGVGGYLVCLGQRVGFGQATANGPVDVPLFADVSRLHAELTRDGEGYVLESGREVMVNGRAATRAVLAAGDRVTLGSTCQFVFHQPVPISPSARLELVSGHRLPLAVDGVLLMAENLILGPAGPVHVPMPDAAGNVILYRSKDGLGVRFPGQFKVDDKVCRDRAALPVPCFVTSESFSFAVEAVSLRV